MQGWESIKELVLASVPMSGKLAAQYHLHTKLRPGIEEKLYHQVRSTQRLKFLLSVLAMSDQQSTIVASFQSLTLDRDPREPHITRDEMRLLMLQTLQVMDALRSRIPSGELHETLAKVLTL